MSLKHAYQTIVRILFDKRLRFVSTRSGWKRKNSGCLCECRIKIALFGLIRHSNRYGNGPPRCRAYCINEQTHACICRCVLWREKYTLAMQDQMLITLILLGNKVQNQFTKRETGRKVVDSEGDISWHARPVLGSRRWGIEIADCCILPGTPSRAIPKP